jgi:CMP-N,N'-diacetyllegionaminic acid synthase
MIIYVDIDNTICTTLPGAVNYWDSSPKHAQIKKINKLFREGHTIIYWTARGTVTQIDWLDLTKEQLDKWGVLYHDVRVGKPEYDLWIDDKSKRIEEI